MDTEELGFRSSLLKGMALSIRGRRIHGRLSRMREEATSADTVTQVGTGIKGLFPVTEETFDWSERPRTR
jgi:hypothetical protein